MRGRLCRPRPTPARNRAVSAAARYVAGVAASPSITRRLGQRYLADTRVYRWNKPFFIDKMPNNFRHIGLIRLMLPNAKIIDVRREPMACCFSNLKQLFASGHEFTYRIEDIARYYGTYLELMRHWDAVLPGRILRLWYEDVVEDLEGNVRRMLEFCALEFDPACVEFYKLKRSLGTASSEQVRQSVFREGLFQWRNFEPWLGSLKEGLGDALIHYRKIGVGDQGWSRESLMTLCFGKFFERPGFLWEWNFDLDDGSCGIVPAQV